mmetsp:Transcript_28012/g.30206  ORF Transcript_28012/g.30206 Transcript_28012/m.30206 type:complete len:146 (+) Transcript_28012:103-540(+)
MFSVAKSTSLLVHRAVAYNRSFVAVQQVVAATGIGAVPVRRDFTAGKTAGEEEEGLAAKEQPRPQKRATVVFRKKSTQYTEFVELVTEKGWLQEGKMPFKGGDKELDKFMLDYEFERRQCRTKFTELLKKNQESSEEEEEVTSDK